MVVAEVLLVLLALVFLWLIIGRRHPLDNFPGPKGLPFIGNALQIDMTNPHLTFVDWTKKYGEVFKITLFGKKMLVVNSFDSIYEVLVTKGKDFAGRGLNNFRSKYITRNNSDVFFMNPTPRWNVLRKTSHRHLKMYASGISRIEQISMEIIGKMVESFRQQEGKDFNPAQHVYNTILNVTAFFAVGKRYAIDSEEFKLFEASERLLFKNLAFAGKGIELDILPCLRFFGNESFKQLKKFVETRDILLKCLREDLEENFAMEKEDKIECVMFALWRLYHGQNKAEKDSEKAISLSNAEMTTLDVIFAGTSTTVSSYYSFLNIIAQHPEIQRRLQKEVDDVVGSSRHVCLSDRDQMPYTRATQLEVLRFSSVVPMGVPHSSIKDTTLLDKHVPAGTEILTNLFALHHQESLWGDPYVFRPERFLDENGELLSPSSEERRHLMPFGAGPRVCVGEILAQTRLFLLVATTSQIFNVKPGKVIRSCDPRGYVLGAISFQPDYEINVESRNKELFN